MRAPALRAVAALVLLMLGRGAGAAGPVERCIAPAQPGGGFELTCLLLREALTPPGEPPLPVLHQPGGIGALVYDEVARGRRPSGAEAVAFSTGTLLNLAQGRFGRHGPDEVRWLLPLALDHGVVVVHREAPWRDLPALLRALREQPGAVAFGAGGTIGSQDWMKAALLARAAGVGPRALRLVAFEGGGDAMRALVGRHVQVLAGDAAEVARQLRQGAPLRVLAVLAPQRLGGALAAVPTAREQGTDLLWPILRGVYVAAALPPAQVQALERLLEQARRRPDWPDTLQRFGLSAPAPAGADPRQVVQAEIDRLRQALEQLRRPPEAR
ncbi:MAG: hypothetical protein RLZZ592_914 [Pseudomonadota bacterium]|jgi:putative tricarboxylic transport membrane protein